MGLVVFFLAFNGMLIGGYLHGRIVRARAQNPPPEPRRLLGAELRAFGIRQVILVLVLWYACDHGLWSPASVGFHGREPWLYSILAGELAFVVLAFSYAGVLHLLGKYPALRQRAVRANLRIWPRGRLQKCFAVLFFMMFNPFTEELVMRGILIHHWSLALGSPVVPIIVGFVLNGALHWYQGWRMQVWHALFFVTAVWLLFSPFGLAAAITAHVFGDVMPIIHLRRQQRSARRARRAAAAIQRA